MKFLAWIAAVVAAVWLVSTFIVQQFVVQSKSMEHTLSVDDRALVNRTAYWFSPITRGDVVVFDGQDSFSAESKDFVKRVIGVEGDRVKCCDDQGRLTVNGEPLDEAPYIYPGDLPSEVTFDIEVPEGKLWMMGDHRSQSSDSRSHLGNPGGGFVTVAKVKGQVVAVMWPLSRLQWISQ